MRRPRSCYTAVVPSAAQKKAPIPVDDPVLQAIARAPLGPADPPEIRAGKDLGRFVPGAVVSAEIARRAASMRQAWKVV
jgi:hypothetical protein